MYVVVYEWAYVDRWSSGEVFLLPLAIRIWGLINLGRKAGVIERTLKQESPAQQQWCKVSAAAERVINLDSGFDVCAYKKTLQKQF